MELTIKHLAAYLPYGLKGLKISKGNFKTDPNIEEIIDLTISDIGAFLKKRYHVISCKPILRPLSMLDKEIEVNGERFIPIYKLWQLAGYELGRGQYIESCPNYIKTSHLGIAIEFKINISDILSSNYNVVEKLCEWHFDIFGLIDAGLAIQFLLSVKFLPLKYVILSFSILLNCIKNLYSLQTNPYHSPLIMSCRFSSVSK